MSRPQRRPGPEEAALKAAPKAAFCPTMAALCHRWGGAQRRTLAAAEAPAHVKQQRT